MKEEEYMRVGTTLYKVVNQPCANGGYEKKRVVWNNSTLRQDYGKNYLATVPKYDGFCTVPNHLNYQKEIEGFLNLYEPIDHKPQQGDFSHIQSLMRHIFGEQYELGYGLYATAVSTADTEAAHCPTCFRGTQYWQKYVLELPESRV